ncbi:MAG: Fic family protein [Oligoflexia bacterium]|nr:Fic family protein [Oligoflexia bacterium]
MKTNFSPKFKITRSILNQLMEIEQARGFLKAAHLSNQWIKNMSKNAFLLETHHTTHIEGTQLTFEQSRKILAGQKVSGLNKEDIKEVKNYRDAFNLVSKHLKEQKSITEALIKAIHKELVKGVRGGSAKPGSYRKIQNYVGNAVTKEIIYTPPKPKEVPALMKDFVRWINQKSDIHPVLKSGIIQFQFVHIHPFVDGNGRTSRLLCTAYLYKEDYDFKKLFSISQYYDKDRKNFYEAIQAVRNNNMDMTVWLEYFIKGFLFQMNEVMDIGKKVILKDALIQNHSLSKRQGIILEYILENGKLLPKDFDKLLTQFEKLDKNLKRKTSGKMTKRTLQRDLKDMIDKKIIETKGKTNQKIYRLLKEGLNL